jgi:hypothetical protein
MTDCVNFSDSTILSAKIDHKSSHRTTLIRTKTFRQFVVFCYLVTGHIFDFIIFIGTVSSFFGIFMYREIKSKSYYSTGNLCIYFCGMPSVTNIHTAANCQIHQHYYIEKKYNNIFSIIPRHHKQLI